MSEHLGLAGNVISLNSFQKCINFESKAQFQTGITPRTVSLDFSCVENSNLKETKRKRKDFDGDFIYWSRSASESCSSEVVSIVSPANVSDKKCCMNLDSNFQLEIDTKNVHTPKAHVVTPLDILVSEPTLNLELNLSTITNEACSPAQHLISQETLTVNFPELVMNDGSSSSSQGYGSSLIPYMRETTVDSTAENIKRKNNNRRTKNCQVPLCQKRARGACGLCIAHGGGKRCLREDCGKVAEGKSELCKLHGGGRRCTHFGCIKSAIGSTNCCYTHGGGRRCRHLNCTTLSRGKYGLCIKHGGGKRCLEENCSKIANGKSCLCISHGGGRRCDHEGCEKGAQGNTKSCKAHGGGKRCLFEGCGKCAQGRTHFCKAHGNDQMCSWGGKLRLDIDLNVPFCNHTSIGIVGLCASHSALVQDRRVRGGEMMGISTSQKLVAPEKLKMNDVEGFCLIGWNGHIGAVSITEGRVHGKSLMASLLAQGDDPLSQSES